MKPKKQKILMIIAIVLFFLLMAVGSIFLGKPILDFLREPEILRAWVLEKGWLARLAFVGIVVVQVILAFIPGEPMEIAAGFAFGVWEGSVLCLLGEALGSILVFLFVRKLGIRAVELFFPPEKHRKLKFLKDPKRADYLLFLLLLIPGTPKDLISYFAGVTPVRFPNFLWITLVARIPSVVSSAWGGDAIGTQNYMLAVLVFLGTAVISLFGLWLFERISARHNEKKNGASSLKNNGGSHA